MFPYARFAKVLATSPRRSKLGPLDTSVVESRVWPGDLDQNGHLNNGRYLTLMDLGRFDLIGRAGMLGALVRRRWYPVVTGATIRFRRGLDPFQKYELHTRVLAWDAEGVYIEQRFVREGRVHALGLIKGLFLGPDGKIPTADVVALSAPGIESPALPKWVEMWDASQGALAEELRAGER